VFKNGVRTPYAGVAAMYRCMSNQGYEVIELDVDPPACRAMLAFLRDQLDKPYVMPWTGVFLAPAPPPPDAPSWWCVQLIVAALQAGGVMHGYNPSALTADELWFWLRMHYSHTTTPRRVPPSDARDAMAFKMLG
jgi:hypothetical protein